MRTLEAVAISRTIIDNVTENRHELINEMAKNGFVCIDGLIKQYNPTDYSFNSVTKDKLKLFIDKFVFNKWNTTSNDYIINQLIAELPQLTEITANNFKAYIKQYLKEIDTSLTETALKKVLAEYERYNNLDVKINDGRDIANQLIIMKQNQIFSDWKTMHLYKYRDGDFQIYNLNDVQGLFNSHLANEDEPIKTSDVQRNRRVYLESLTNIHDIRVELKNKKKKENTLKTCETDYKTVLKLLKEY